MPEIPGQPLDERLDYRRMWATLRDELSWCAGHNIQGIHPFIVIAYMNFIQRLAEFDKKGPANES